ncbi:MAG: Arm DNA-binding domain-containing protein, partial [Geobacteraceae bacterium]|nr:Arm DNA-binding domain-containing protein [Geobacteraceae bacterium]
MKQKFTDTFLRNLKPDGNQDRDIIEGQGFGVKVRACGSRVFFYKYRFRNKLRFMNLGAYPQTSLAGARQKCGNTYKPIFGSWSYPSFTPDVLLLLLQAHFVTADEPCGFGHHRLLTLHFAKSGNESGFDSATHAYQTDCGPDAAAG